MRNPGDALAKEADQLGLRVDKTTRGHWRARLADGTFIATWSPKPTCSRGMRNARAALRRAGVPVSSH